MWRDDESLASFVPRSGLGRTAVLLPGYTIKDVAQETHLDWKTIKELAKQYMGE